jgi:hypothetical protein
MEVEVTIERRRRKGEGSWHATRLFIFPLCDHIYVVSAFYGIFQLLEYEMY